MRKPSRLMLPAPKRRVGVFGWVALTVAGCGLFSLLWEHTVGTLVVLLVFAVLIAFSTKRDRARLVSLAASRSSGGGICSFARNFDLRHVDPWVVRAVYEEVSGYFKGLGFNVNIEADDDLVVDLGIDPDEIDMHLATDIAARAGRSFETYRANPFYRATNTVRGLVMFFNAQPRVPPEEQGV